MFLLGVILVALAILGSVTALALATSGFLRHAWAAAAAIAVTLALGLLLLAAYGKSSDTN